MELAKELYNYLLERNIRTYKETKKHSSYIDMLKWITELKKTEPKYREINAHALANVSKRVSEAFTHFFRRLKEKKAGKRQKVGFPRFKKYASSLTFPDPLAGFAYHFESNKILVLSKIGRIPIKLHRTPKGKIKTCTIKRERSGKWFVSFVTDIQHEPRPQFREGAIGVDLGCTSLIALSNGETVENPHFYKQSQKRRAFLQRLLCRKKKGSENRKKARHRLAVFDEKISDARKDFLDKLSTNLITHHEFLVLEDLGIRNMVKNHHLAGTILDSSWGAFAGMLRNKAESAGCEVIFVNPKNTTKQCSECGALQDVPLSERTYCCPVCGATMDRDVNAARNILKLGIAGHAKTYACRDSPSTVGLQPTARRVVEAGTELEEIP